MSTQYAGNDSFPSDYTIPDDGDARAAVSVNVALEALGDRTAWLKPRLDFLRQIGVQNWPYQNDGSFTFNTWAIGNADWDPFNQLWVANLYDVGGQQAWVSQLGADWTQLGSAFGATAATFACVVVDRDTGHIYATSDSEISDWDGASWTTGATGASFVFATGRWFNSKAVFVGYNGAATKVGTFTTGGGWSTGTTPGGVTVTDIWKSAIGGGIMLAVPGRDAVGAAVVGMTTTDGTTWVAATIPTSASEKINDVAYAAGVFAVAVETAGGDTKVFTSTTGATGSWTLVATLTDKVVTSLCGVGEIFFGSFGSLSDPGLGLLSLDAGVTWRRAHGFDNLLACGPEFIDYSGVQVLARNSATSTDIAAGSMIVGLGDEI